MRLYAARRISIHGGLVAYNRAAITVVTLASSEAAHSSSRAAAQAPRQQLVDVARGMILHAGEDVGEVLEGIDRARLARRHERVQTRETCGFASAREDIKQEIEEEFEQRIRDAVEERLRDARPRRAVDQAETGGPCAGPCVARRLKRPNQQS